VLGSVLKFAGRGFRNGAKLAEPFLEVAKIGGEGAAGIATMGAIELATMGSVDAAEAPRENSADLEAQGGYHDTKLSDDVFIRYTLEDKSLTTPDPTNPEYDLLWSLSKVTIFHSAPSRSSSTYGGRNVPSGWEPGEVFELKTNPTRIPSPINSTYRDF